MTVYDFKLTDNKGKDVDLKDYEGKVLLIVNTATQCGFTPQYDELEALYEKYHDKGFEIIDIPCNQFAGQTPESDEEIENICRLKFDTKFPRMKKSDVNGENALPLYGFLKSQAGFKGFGKGPKALAMAGLLLTIDRDYKNNPEIKWNFTKFLTDRMGNVVGRYEATSDMKEMEKDIEKELAK